MAAPQRACGLSPVVGPGCRALVLGSFPSVLSRETDFYYGNPRNRFWRVLSACLGEPVPADDDLAEKRALLLRHGIALWDVVASCVVEGSADSSIREVVPVDLSLVTSVAPVGRVLCNGGVAGRLYRRWLEPSCGLAARVLPSTSPANVAWSLERLVGEWGPALREAGVR